MHEVDHACVYDGLGLRYRGLAAGLRSLHCAGQVVYGVQVHVFQCFHLGLNVARYGQVHHKDRAVFARFYSAFYCAQADDGQRAGGAADDGVKLVQAAGQFSQVHGVRVGKFGGQQLAALDSAVGNNDGFGVLGSKVRDGQFNHLACAHKQHFDITEVFKQLPAQPHRRRRHADAVRANLSVAAHIFGHGKAALKQLVQCGAHRTGVFGGAHGVFHLAQYLRLAQHHRVEPAGDAKGVAGCIALH